MGRSGDGRVDRAGGGGKGCKEREGRGVGPSEKGMGGLGER